MQAEGLEAALATLEAEAESTLRAAASVVRELKRAKASAASGQIRDLRKVIDQADALASQLAEKTNELKGAWRFDAQTHLESGGYVRELLDLAAEEKVHLYEEDGALLCHPALVRLIPTEEAIEIDKKRERRIRPSVVVRRLRALQAKPARFRPETFVEALLAAYELKVKAGGLARDALVRLIDLHEILTLLPGTRRDYSLQEFARDVYLLDQSGVTRTRAERDMLLEVSTLTKGRSVLATVSREGRRVVYAGVRFS